MDQPFLPLNTQQLIDIFALTKTATAIHIGENAVIAFANDAMLRIWGKSKDVTGKSLEDALPELKGQPFIEMFASVWREGLTISGRDTAAELEVDGKLQTFYFDFEYRAITGNDGKTMCILHSATDVTDRVLGEQALQYAREKSEALEREQALNEELAASSEELSATIEELQKSRDSLNMLNDELEERVQQRTLDLSESEGRFRMMAENTDMLIATTEANGRISYLNQAWLDFLGLTQYHLTDFSWTDFIHPEEKNIIATTLQQAFNEHKPYASEFRMLCKNKGYRWLIFKGSPRLLTDGSFAGMVSSALDITERKLAEIERQTLNTIMESSPEFIVLSGLDSQMMYANPAALKKLGWHGISSRNILDCVFPDDLDLAQSLLPALWEDEKFSREIRFYNELTGIPFWVEWNAFVIRDKKTNDLIGWGTVSPDITDRKKHEEELQAINEELAASNEELATTNEELELSHLELQISEGRFRNLIRQSPFAICVIRAEDLMILEANDKYVELVGKPRHLLERRTIWDAVSEAADVYAPVMQSVINSGMPFVANEHEVSLIRNGVPENVILDFIYEPVLNAHDEVSTIMVVAIDVTEKILSRRKIEDIEERIRLAVNAGDIGTYDFNYGTNEIVTSDRFNQIFGFDRIVTRDELLNVYHPSDRHLSADAHKEAAITGKIFYEARIIHPDQSTKWIRVQGTVFFGPEEKRTRVLGTVLDITHFKHLQQQKDDFISIASHELKTPITSLKASLQLLDRMKHEPDTDVFSFLIDQSAKSMGKISELVEDLLNVSRMNEGQLTLNKTKFTLSKMLNECCNHVRIEARHELIFQGDENLEVVADEQRIDQVVVNFVNNAVKYAPNSREIFMIVEKQEDMVKVSVKDYGPGIAKEKIPHLFDRYYRADESGVQISGLGLGLYISADIIARHNGRIGVDSEEGRGSTFWFMLPLQ
jgi:PAS domain S-box-containing protein